MKKIIFIIFAFLLLIISGCGEKEIIKDLQSQITEKNEIIEKLRAENARLTLSLQGPLEELVENVDTTNWDSDDYVQAMLPYTKKLVSNNWLRYQYRSDGAYYYLEADLFGIDPFYNVVYDRDNIELNTSRLRIFGLSFGDTEKGTAKYSDYESKVNRKSLIDTDLTCTNTLECNDIKVIKCSKSGQTYISWFDGNSLFEIKNDEQIFEAFKKFYCG